MAAAGYACKTEGAVALVAATAKTIIGVKAHANSGIQLKSYEFAFDGVTASGIPVLVELCYVTFATNSPSTASTTTTPVQKYGRVLTAGFTSAKNWTTEPTVVTPIDEFLITPNAGAVLYQNPLGQEHDTALAEGLCFRLNAPAAVNVRATMNVERI